ncbi:hypothetical protein JOC85_003483 [Bacillus mesophilus]|uniref:Uncharacterized protein n=1 Tax=Bacillus mesophilus TaxID=1808955 RepID=A0A6M0QA61_9BACI|nr:hypothetical protein [Bacillus mesophilus]MBM7662673.1 hypothetical protein [Bacillus mesophilus]NEY73264.1 hypothetical protein [Bacillus mesophilus]
MNSRNAITKDLEIAGQNILKLVSKLINVNTFCITSISETESYFITVLNRHIELASAGTLIPVTEAY